MDRIPEVSETLVARRLPWPRFAAEMAAIVLSILLAFSIDAWWGDVQDRGAEVGVLDGLRGEFAQHLAELEEAAEWSESAVAATDLLARVGGGGAVLSDSLAMEVERAVSWVNSSYMVDLRGGVRDALINSGQLAIVENQELRERLSGWNSVVDDVGTNEATIRQFVMGVLSPFLASTGVPLERSLTWPVGEGRVAPPTPEHRELYGALIREQHFQNLLTVRRLWDLGSQAKYRRATEEAQAILDLVARELEGH